MKEIIKSKIEEDIKKIFGDMDISSLSDYEKRNMIFDYLSSNIQYDWILYSKILYNKIRKNTPPIKLNRNYKEEFENVVTNHIGVCLAISMYYKELLSIIGIKSIVIGTDDGTPVSHVLNLVYDEERKTYSFDDVTSKITRKRSKEKTFDYDLEDANDMKQGLRPIIEKYDINWIPLGNITPRDFQNIIPLIYSIKKNEQR